MTRDLVVALVTLAGMATPLAAQDVDPAPIAVRGTELAVWTQSTRPAEPITHYQFVSLIDGQRSAEVAAASCLETAIVNEYECSSPLPVMEPGMHVFELIAIDVTTGLESAPSAPIRLEMLGAAGSTLLSRAATGSARGGVSSRVCASGGAPCFAVDTAVTGLRDVSAVAALPDGRLLVVQQGTRVSVWDGVATSTAFEVAGGAAGITVDAIAVDTAFASSRFVYLALVSRDDEGTRVSIVRTREVAGTLGEAAVIVGDLAIAAAPAPAVQLLVGPDRLLYLATPGDAASIGRAALLSAKVLRFGSDGAAAGSSTGPVLADGSSMPGALAWIGDGLWLGDRSGDGGALRVVGPASGKDSRRPGAVSIEASGVLQSSQPTSVGGLVPLVPGGERVGLLDSGRRLLLTGMLDRGPAGARLRGLEPLVLGPVDVVSIAAADDGTVFVVVVPAAGSATSPAQSVIRLRPIQP